MKMRGTRYSYFSPGGTVWVPMVWSELIAALLAANFGDGLTEKIPF